MAHANAALTPKHRLRLARLIVDEGWPPSRAAEFFNVSWRTAAKWAQRYRDEGVTGMLDRPSARHSQHAKTPQPMVRKIVRAPPLLLPRSTPIRRELSSVISSLASSTAMTEDATA